MGGESQGEDYDVRAVRESDVGSGVPHGAVLLRFVEAAIGDDERVLADARAALAAGMGEAAVADAAAIVATFQLVDRVADATGIPLDAIVDIASADVQAELGLREFGSARNTPARILGRFVGRAMAPLRSRLLGLARLLRR